MDPVDRLVDLLSTGPDVPLAESLFVLAEARPGPVEPAAAGLDALDAIALACPEATVEGLIRHLFVDHGFAGDRDDYHDPRNSYLDEVVRRRRGMPITLSVVLVEIGRRLGIGLVGVGLPGHFLVREHDDPDGFIDPYHGGVRIGADACVARFRALHGDAVPFHPSYLDPVPSRSIVQRVLNNLTVTFRSRSLHDLDWLLDIRLRLPADPPDLRALSELCELRGRYGDAADLLDQLAASGPDDRDRTRIRERAARLRARLN